MNGWERREIIDELAGVAEFDRKIAEAKQIVLRKILLLQNTLNSIRERADGVNKEELIVTSRIKEEVKKGN